MATLIEAIDIKRKMFFEFEGAPYLCLDVEVYRPTRARSNARAGQDAEPVTRAVFDKTFKAGENS